MKVYYNEWEPYCAQWLRNLIDAGHLPPGDVDERSITDVEPEELKGYTQHHFFAGIGGWALAARLAGVSESERIVTGSPPCQPFSTAGRGGGYSDERHLAPHWLRLVAAIRPTWVFGEQVAAAIRKDDWLDDLLDALEAEGYATGATVLPACSVGAPHIRQRLWVAARLAYPDNEGLQRPCKSFNQHVPTGWRAEEGCDNQGALDAHFWRSAFYTKQGADGKLRHLPQEDFSGIDGLPHRVGSIRAYGNAVVPQLAAEVIKEAMNYDY